MGLFTRRKPAEDPADLGTLLLQGQDMIEQLGAAHRSWGLGTADRWGLDQTAGVITWTFPDRVATAPAQILGSYSRSGGSWMWAWANRSILPEMSRDARAVRDWARQHGVAALVEPQVEADDETASTLAALAVRISGATGFYKPPQGASFTFVTFGAVTIAAADGTTSTFTIEIPEGRP